jgi:hypothetical protein
VLDRPLRLADKVVFVYAQHGSRQANRKYGRLADTSGADRVRLDLE